MDISISIFILPGAKSLKHIIIEYQRLGLLASLESFKLFFQGSCQANTITLEASQTVFTIVRTRIEDGIRESTKKRTGNENRK